MESRDGEFTECCPWPKYCERDGTCYREEMRKSKADTQERLRELRRSRRLQQLEAERDK